MPSLMAGPRWSPSMATLILHRLLAEEAGHFFRGAGVGDLTHRAQTWLMVDMLPEADRLALAEACLRYAVLKAPQYGRTYCNLGYVLEAQGQLAAALRQY